MGEINIVTMLKNIASTIAKILGPTTEVVLHDLTEQRIIFIENGYVTGRKVGDNSNQKVMEVLFENIDENGVLVNYASNTKMNGQLRSSTILIKDEEGTPLYSLCVNQDISALNSAKEILSTLTATIPITPEEAVAGEVRDENIQEITNQVILAEIERMKPLSLANKEVKLEIVRKLDEKGVFDVKDAVGKVCELLSISQATLYNYQRELRVSGREIRK